MEQKLKELVEPAFREVPASEANVAIARARREQAGGDPDDDDAPVVRSYELVLTTWDRFVREQLPRLIYHLESVGAHLPECRGVMLSVFVDERLCFVNARAAVTRICQMLGVTPDQLSERYGLHEKRTAVNDQPLLLPPTRARN